MPPKKGKKDAEPPPPDAGKELEELTEAMEKESKEINRLQLERDKIQMFWKRCKEDLSNITKVELTAKDGDMEEAEQSHRVEINEYKQQLNQLKLEHHKAVCDEKERTTQTIDQMQIEHGELETELRQRIRDLKLRRKEQELACETLEKELKLKHDEDLTKMREDFERQIKDTKDKYKKKESICEREQDLRRRREVRETEERYNSRIAWLTVEYKNIKIEYSKIKHRVPEMKELLLQEENKAKRREEKMSEVVTMYTRLSAELCVMKKSVKDQDIECKKRLRYYEQEITNISNLRARLAVSVKDIKDMEYKHEVLLQLHDELTRVYADLKKKYNQVIQEMQQKSGFKNLLLLEQRKLEATSPGGDQDSM